jgi:hypothetical protein
MTWKALARSAPGINHVSRGLPCQDYGAYQCFDEGNTIVGAVADGAGSSKHSELGAKLAVKIALLYTQKWLTFLKKRRVKLSSLPKQALSKHLHKTVEAVKNFLEKVAIARNHTANDFNCTLLLFIATPNWVAAMQIGDGFIVVKPVNGNYRLVFEPDKGEFINQTNFVTSLHVLQEARIEVLLDKYEFVCASTDGLERLAIRTADWVPGSGFFMPLEDYMHATPHPETEDQYVLEFLNSERLNARTDDDKTLLLCLYKDNSTI